MIRWNNQHWTVLGSAALVQGTQWIGAGEVLAHGGSHGREAEHDAKESHAQTSETMSVESTPSSPETPDTGSAPQSSVNPQSDSENDVSIEEVPAMQKAPTASVARASTSDSFSIGLGESLLGLIIAGPFLLTSLKKQLQS